MRTGRRRERSTRNRRLRRPVRFRVADRIEIRIDQADGWRGFFHFRDDAEAAQPAVQGGAEAAEVIALQGGGAQHGSPRHQRFDFLAFVGDDFRELVRHGWREKKGRSRAKDTEILKI